MIDDITGNLTHIPDSVILNIDSSTNTSSSESENDEMGCHELLEEEEVSEEADGDEDEQGDLHCDDWEIRMLAAELQRRESAKREEPASSETTSEADDSSDLLRQRSRHRSETNDTDTEYSEMETEQVSRPRAASLDQYNLRRDKTKGVIKALSFDRDKDRL